MPSNFEQFRQQIDSAVDLINQSTDPHDANPVSKSLVQGQTIADIVDTHSLLDRCDTICAKYESRRPTIRVIHHLACSGGTLISKCISAMPNVFLLSEAHPYTDLALGKDKPKYAPSDIISLSKYAGIPKQRELSGRIFKQSIDRVYEHVTELGGILVLRDHTHADFNTQERIPEKSEIISLLEEDYKVKSILTIRDPIDSYASLVKNGWVHFEPNSFDEYCRRLLLLIERFKPEQILKYEDFVEQPTKVSKQICEALELTFDDAFEQTIALFRLTGDSGRASDVITKRERAVESRLFEEARMSEKFKYICKQGWYSGHTLSNTLP